jgi:hypothetical protein
MEGYSDSRNFKSSVRLSGKLLAAVNRRQTMTFRVDCLLSPPRAVGSRNSSLTGQIEFGAKLGPKLGLTGPNFDSLAAEGQLNQRGLWSGRWESNPKLNGLNMLKGLGIVATWGPKRSKIGRSSEKVRQIALCGLPQSIKVRRIDPTSEAWVGRWAIRKVCGDAVGMRHRIVAFLRIAPLRRGGSLSNLFLASIPHS